MFFGGALVLLGIGAGVVAAAVMVSRRDTPVQPKVVAAIPPPHQSQTDTTTLKPVQAPAAEETRGDATESKPIKVASAAPPKVVTPKKAEPQPKSAVAPPTPAILSPQPAAPPAIAKAETSPVAVEPTPAKPTENEMDKLPILSESERVRLGLIPLKINIVGIPNNRNPRASALINMQKVYVGETIPGTSARLVDVSLRGVSLSINGTRYFLSR
jgi:hypothetical protein